MPDTETLSGILLMNKPAGFTSHDVVAKLRGILHMRRIGHGGTLDPMATGVLPVFLGGATRAADFAAAQQKEYVAGFTLGYSTDTQDTTGTTVSMSGAVAALAAVERAAAAFEGTQMQIPPMYSAVQVGGKRLYDLARQGKTVERAAREITVHKMELLEFDENAQTGTLRIVCSKGTYVRTLINDMGERLRTLAVMNSLCRTRAGDYRLEDCLSFETVEQAMQAGTASALLRGADSLFSSFPAAHLSEEGTLRAQRGAVVFPRQVQGMPETAEALCRVYDNAGRFMMLGRVGTLDKGGLGLFVYKNFR